MAVLDMVRPKPSFLAFLGSAVLNLNCLLHGVLLQSQIKFIVPASSVKIANMSVIIISPVMCTNMTRLEAAEMRFLRSVTGYTRLDEIRSEVKRTRYL
jgi:hypothetical protein